MEWTLGEAAEAVGGRLEGAAAGARVSGASIDTRSLRTGELFFAIKGERDGHDWVGDAVARGAVAAVVDHAINGPSVIVSDTGRALMDLGRAARARVGGAVVGITGSVGKTSTKDLTAAAVGTGMPVVASARSWNNELGLPLTLINSPAHAEVAILEMGARGPGHIAMLCDIARPTVGVVTAVAAAHTETFGDLDGVAKAKGELVEALPPEGTAVLNADDPRVAAMSSRTRARVLSYSASGSAADVVAAEVQVDADLRPSFLARTPWGEAEVRLEARGAHQVGNALAALTVAGAVGVDVAAAAAALREAALSAWRMEVSRSLSGATVINDAYNANPASLSAALHALAALPARRRVAVLGVMAELGDRHREDHRRMAELAGSLGIEILAVGTADYGAEPLSPSAAVEAISAAMGPETAVLVKGSRVAGLENVASELLGR